MFKVTTTGIALQEFFIYRTAMGRITYLLICLAVFMFLPGHSAGQQGFKSINCGGSNFTDSSTTIQWDSDNDLVNHHGKIASLQNATDVPFRTLRFFPNDPRNTKFCYSLSVSNGSTYLVRASFLYGNYDALNKPPSFVLLLNYDVWNYINVTAATSTQPIVYEIIYISLREFVSVCLAPHPDSTDTPFISTLELRPLNFTMYKMGTSNSSGGLNSGYGLRLAQRINYGATSSNAIRYPDDEFDRIWGANTTGPILSTTPNSMSTFSGEDPEVPPAKVMATAITTNNTENLTIVVEGFGGVGNFRIELHFAEVQPGLARTFDITFPEISLQYNNPVMPQEFVSISAVIDQPASLQSFLQVTLVPVSADPPLVNAIELFTWTDSPLQRTGTAVEDLSALTIIQVAFNLTGDGDGDPCMPKDYKWSWVVCSNASMPRIIEIHLASFDITGTIPSIMNNLVELQNIDLSNNMLHGSIPDLDSLVNLKSLNLDNNNLCGTIPSFLSMKNITFTYGANPNLCKDSCTCNQSSLVASNGQKYVYIISCLVSLYILSMVVVIVRNQKEKMSIKATDSTKRGNNNIDDVIFITKHFTYEEISNATTQFTTKIGEGGFGKVFQGVLQNGDVVAVKMLSNASKQGQKEFTTEVSILSRFRHRNLVSLVGYCIENTYMLIYEYISKGNLRELLYGEGESMDKPLPWITRLKIALDASRGLEYLHMDCDPTIIHRDIKSSNILLNDKMQAKVADFGLSRLKASTVSHVSTENVAGTLGYLDPEFNYTNQLTDKSDVYSFGVVLFELISGRPPISSDFSNPTHIVSWATSAILKGNVEDIVDPVLTNGYKLESMWKVIDVAFGCVESERSKRPSMSEVVHILREAVNIEMDNTHNSEDATTSSTSTTERKTSMLCYVESLRLKLEPKGIMLQHLSY